MAIHGEQGRIHGGRGAARALKLEKNKIFWRKIVIFHTKYLKNFRASLRSAQFFGPVIKFIILKSLITAKNVRGV